MSQPLIFDPRKHLTPADVVRLKEHAKAAGLSEDDFLEATVKKTIWSTATPGLPPMSSPVKRRRVPLPIKQT